ncbi:MAG TPA: hypothetical protein VLN47_07010 [Clostridiaceae bacterium]|nr:hypothetical protein [Clostridiaceae bacterium]
MKNMYDLLEAEEPWVVYRTMVDLLDREETETEVLRVKKEMLRHPLVLGLIEELREWPGVVISSHKSAGQLYHKLAFLADLGITIEDDGMEEILSKVSEHVSEQGLFQLPMDVPHHSGAMEKQWAWALCDAPLLLYSAAKMGMKDDADVRKGVDYLVSLVRENGWPCAVSEELGKFRGPGKKADSCPYADLVMMRLLALFPEYRKKKEARTGAECLLKLWDESESVHPYMFYMGTDFRKLKAPFIWYDILHVADVLSQFDFVIEDTRFLNMLQVIREKAGPDGSYTPESEWKAWKGWDFGQKKKPSAWMTFLVYRIMRRVKEYEGWEISQDDD